MERNRELFEKIAAQIEETPHLWDQRIFAGRTDCGTAMCVAGWATHFTCGLVEETEGSDFFSPANGESFVDHGAEVLGLDIDEAMDLFHGTWDEAFGRDAGQAAEFLRAIGRGARFDARGDWEPIE